MAAEVRSRGLAFAEKEMRRLGWEKGKGLGKRETGISEAIRVKVKCDSAGVGHDPGEAFSFHWWDHLFNASAAKISVQPGQNGVQVGKVSEDEGEPPARNKKPRKALKRKDMLYGRFIKASTLTSKGEEPLNPAHPSDSSSSEEEEAKLDLSSAKRLTDEELVKACGGRTAHKGARHGFTMSAKLARLEEQEAAFLAKYLPQKAPHSEQKGERKAPRRKEGALENPEEEEREGGERPKKKKKKKKRRKEEEEEEEENMGEEPSQGRKKKAKRKRKGHHANHSGSK